MPRTTGRDVVTTTLGESVRAFLPYPLPPADPPLAPTCYVELNRLAELALARLVGVSGLVPSVDWLLYSAIRKVALLSSQIEGTQATLTDPKLDRRHPTGQRRLCAPPPGHLADLLTALERFIHAAGVDLPPLVRVALIHAQFETIHPFLDGNGRIGRLLIAALFEHWGLLKEPLMYLSGYLKRHQAEYYRRLNAIRSDGDWEAWVSFFLDGVATAALDAEHGIIDVASLISADRKRLLQAPKAGPISFRRRTVPTATRPMWNC